MTDWKHVRQLQTQLEHKDKEINALTTENRRLKLSQETLTRDATHDAQRRRKTDSQSETSMLSAMQRVKWLTSKKSELEEGSTRDAAYIKKLESRLVSLDAEVQALKKQMNRPMRGQTKLNVDKGGFSYWQNICSPQNNVSPSESPIRTKPKTAHFPSDESQVLGNMAESFKKFAEKKGANVVPGFFSKSTSETIRTVAAETA